jgi:hypothetical protein
MSLIFSFIIFFHPPITKTPTIGCLIGCDTIKLDTSEGLIEYLIHPSASVRSIVTRTFDQSNLTQVSV